jgi:hypothetical protein
MRFVIILASSEAADPVQNPVDGKTMEEGLLSQRGDTALDEEHGRLLSLGELLDSGYQLYYSGYRKTITQSGLVSLMTVGCL